MADKKYRKKLKFIISSPRKVSEGSLTGIQKAVKALEQNECSVVVLEDSLHVEMILDEDNNVIYARNKKGGDEE